LRKFKPTKFADKAKEHPTPLLTLKIVTTFSMLKPFTDKGAYLVLYSYRLCPPEFLLGEAIDKSFLIARNYIVENKKGDNLVWFPTILKMGTKKANPPVNLRSPCLFRLGFWLIWGRRQPSVLTGCLNHGWVAKMSAKCWQLVMSQVRA